MKNIHNIAVIGSSGAIGRAFTEQSAIIYPNATVHAFSRTQTQKTAKNIAYHTINYDDAESLKEAASLAAQDTPLDRVVVATGILHDGNIMPEKSLSDIAPEKFHRLFAVNTIVPALIAKYFIPKLRRDHRSIFAVLSARIGSISDNRIGGWYAYRASKAALNMMIKNAAIETARRNKNAVIVGLHPGTVKSALSEPFQANVPEEKLFTPDFSVKKLIRVLEHLTPESNGKCFAWDGTEIKP